MAAPAEERVAVVLGHLDYGESDRILRLLIAQEGLVPALARSARKSSKRFGGALDVGDRARVMIRPGRGELWHLDGAELLDGRPRCRDDLGRICLLPYLCEWGLNLAREGHDESRLFGLLDVALTVLDGVSAPPSDLFRLGFEAKALTFAGLAPQLTRCVSCAAALGEEPLVYDVGLGGVAHARCGGGLPLSADDAARLERARRTPLVELIDESPLECSPWLFAEHLRWHTHRDLKSLKVLQSVG